MNGKPSLFLFMSFSVLYQTYLFDLISADSLATALPYEVQTWSPDNKFEFKSAHGIRASTQDPGRPEFPKDSAAIFQNEFIHKFNVFPGSKIIRLHFYPTSYAGLNISKALFSVSIGHYTLLRTSESSYPTDASDIEYVTKEFCLYIEVVPVPPDLYMRDNETLSFIGHSNSSYRGKSMALETMYRLNVGGPPISAEHDHDMFRAWSGDDIYFMSSRIDTETLRSKAEIKYSSQVPAYIAPKKVYTSARTTIPSGYSIKGGYNLTWSFQVESGFYYLLRLHFCEISKEITEQDQRVFHIHINDQIAQDGADVIKWSGGADVPVFRDYVVNLSEQGMDNLLLSLQSNTENGTSCNQAILNGLEIFKLPDASYNFAGSISFRARRMSLSSAKNPPRMILEVVFDIATVVAVLCIICYVHFFYISRCSLRSICRRKTFKQRQSDHFRHFSLPEIKSATHNFSDSLVIGSGGFGNVYKGYIDGGTTTVAIKRANPCSNQGLNEFKTEISMLSNLQHGHLVSLIGYCMENKEMILHEKVNLGEWALSCYQLGTLETIIDPYLRDKIEAGCFKTFTDIAKKCLADKGCDRPNMGDVLWNLEMALRQQEAAVEDRICAENNNGTTSYSSLKIDGHPCIGMGNSDQTPGVEFSEIMVTIGR
ncbi:hypothetical protein Pint_23455 [Pistacia integerrima]|uniref:Uncharacterized protein n=1 Tax=Pistacia integerrima TaxID=434235 RepID=A0ACC0YKN9_9ROSI|nr:hypothetical protein Pint_23455 [Pistacia integerrima]